ncbi:MAG: STAS domain-containing protein [bacterium]|nr:STAS domain-containing protein [Myxococcales bacterium]MCB9543206.1 STAS domain-containing protein [Myxococcales bacterium]MCB9553667.1 STAS domain-containing protein [Myxococcales bacterium]
MQGDLQNRIPILEMEGCLLVSVQVDVDDQLAVQLEDDLGAAMLRTGARGILIDISGVGLVDTFLSRILGNIAEMSRMLGAEAVLVGMQPAVAITLVELGMNMAGVHTALDIDRGLARLRKSLGRRA